MKEWLGDGYDDSGQSMEPMEEVLLEELRVSQNQRRPEAYLMTQITYSESTIVACTQSRKTNSFYECVLKIAFTKSTFFSPKCTKYCLAAGLRSDPLGSLQRTPDLLAGFNDAYF